MKRMYLAAVLVAGVLAGCVAMEQEAATKKAGKPQWGVSTAPFDVATRAAEAGKDPLAFVAGSWTLVVVGDVQNYNDVGTKHYPVEKSLMARGSRRTAIGGISRW